MAKKLVDAATQAQWFSRVREDHRTETTEDYVELIADLHQANQSARLSDLAQRFGVTNATASKILNRIKEEGYITSEPYGPLYLTEAGKALAERCKIRHQIIVDFLLKLGVSREIAESDAEGIEHHISPETLETFKNFTR